MNIQKILYIQVNKSFHSFKTLDLFSFDLEVKKFLSNNLRIENIAQLDEIIYLITKCQSYNLIALANLLDKLLSECLFFKKMLSTYYKNPNNLIHEMNDAIQKKFIVIYHENKDYILTNEHESLKFLKSSNDIDISTVDNSEKQMILIKLLSFSNTFKEQKKIGNFLNNERLIIKTIIELLKIL